MYYTLLTLERMNPSEPQIRNELSYLNRTAQQA